MLIRLRQLELKKHRLANANGSYALETQPAFAEIEDDGSVIRAKIRIRQTVDPATHVRPALDLRC
jgi:hypothetical protein